MTVVMAPMKRFLIAFLLCYPLLPANTQADGADAPPPPDERMAQKVTVKTIGKPLGDFLADLSAQTGVTMTAHRDVADDKLVVLAKDIPLSDVQDAIAQVLHLRCSRENKEGEWSYEFWMDLRTRMEIERIKKEEIRKLRNRVEELAAKATKMAEEDNKAAQEHTDEDLSSKEDSDLYDEDTSFEEDVGFLDDSDFSDLFYNPEVPALITYHLLNPRQLAALWRGERVVLDLKEAPSGLHKLLLRYIWQFGSMQMEGGELIEYSPAESINDISYRLAQDKDTNRPALKLEVNFTQESSSAPAIQSTIPRYISIPGDEQNEEDSEDTSQEEAQETDENEEVESETSDEPEPEKSPPVYELMERIHDEDSVNIVSDYFTRLSPRQLDKQLAENEADVVLKEIARRLGAELSSQKSVQLLITNVWYRNHEREIPDRLVKRWKQLIEKNKGYNLQDTFELAQLNNYQLADLHLYGLGDGNSILDAHEALKLTATLSPQQLEAANTDDGLPASELTNHQFDMLVNWARSEKVYALHNWTPDAMRQGKLYIEQPETDENPWSFNFEVREDIRLWGHFFLQSLNESLPARETETTVTDGKPAADVESDK